jgi:hypothetical protein
LTVARYTISTHVVAPPEHVYALWIDLEGMGDRVGGVTGVTDLSGSTEQDGTTYVVHFGPMRSPTEIVEVERPRSSQLPKFAAKYRRPDPGHLVMGVLARIVRRQLSRRAREVRPDRGALTVAA